VATLSGLLFTPEMKQKLKKIARATEVLDLNSFRTYQNVVASGFARDFEIPYLVRAHGSLPRLGKTVPKWIFDRVYGQAILRDSSALVAVSPVEADQYRKSGADANKIAMIPNGLELSDFSNLPTRGEFASRFKLKQNTRIILFLGRINRIKGIDTLIKAYSQLVRDRRHSDCLLVIAGPDDGYLREAQLLARRLGLGEEILFCGMLNLHEKIAALVDSDVVILPSYYEVFGIVVLEAYACSKPVIASRQQAMEDIVIDRHSGLLFSPGNVEELTSAISLVLKDPE
jgi:glycosyltransferase involved in cell wall biosynthesis